MFQCKKWVAAAVAALAVGVSGAYAEEPKGDVYSLATCIVSGKELGDTQVIKTIEGREIRLCCEGCVGKVEAAPAEYFGKVDEKIIAEQKATYPLEFCIVMEEDKLIPGKTDDIVYKNRLLSFCCSDCIDEFNADPAKWLAALDKKIIEKQEATVSKVCPVSGKEVGEGSVNYVVANKLIKFCCNNCVATFEKTPAKYLKTAQAAAPVEALKISLGNE